MKHLRVADVAKMTGLTAGSVYQYVWHGILPGPVMRIGPVNFFDAKEVRAFWAVHEGRPNARKSVRGV